MKPSKPDWLKVAQPDTSYIGDRRSCANCLHCVKGEFRHHSAYWRCNRVLDYCLSEIQQGRVCGSELKLWTPILPKPSIWQRLVGWWSTLC